MWMSLLMPRQAPPKLLRNNHLIMGECTSQNSWGEDSCKWSYVGIAAMQVGSGCPMEHCWAVRSSSSHAKCSPGAIVTVRLGCHIDCKGQASSQTWLEYTASSKLCMTLPYCVMLGRLYCTYCFSKYQKSLSQSNTKTLDWMVEAGYSSGPVPAWHGDVVRCLMLTVLSELSIPGGTSWQQRENVLMQNTLQFLENFL